MNVLSIQSQVVYGHVGNSAAAFVLQRQGHAVWQVPTVLFSNHLGKPTFRGRAVPAEQARDLIQGLKELGYLDDVDMLLTGYLGTPDTARLAAELAGIIRAQKPHAIFACDPVMGDDDALYVKPDLAEAIASDLVPIADVLLPNIFELARLTGRTSKTAPPRWKPRRRCSGQSGVKVLVATGIPAERPDRIAALALAGGKVHRAEAPRRKLRVSGTGDTFSARCSPATTCATATPPARSTSRCARMDVICTATEKADADELHDRADPERLGKGTRSTARDRFTHLLVLPILSACSHMQTSNLRDRTRAIFRHSAADALASAAPAASPEALSSVEEAKMADAAGDEAGCMEYIGKAKELLGLVE